MPDSRQHLELPAPARNAEFGIEAIIRGADAADIERLASHAHRYHARVLVALNTLLKDEEVEPARLAGLASTIPAWTP